jgi:2'-5' RNA ligase
VVPALGQIRFSPFTIQLEEPGFFDRAGVFFAGVGLSPELIRLQELVVAATRPCGFVPEDRPYHPHITLARTKAGRSALAALKPRIVHAKPFSAFTAREFLVYESFPGPGGSRYEVRNHFELEKRG